MRLDSCIGHIAGKWPYWHMNLGLQLPVSGLYHSACLNPSHKTDLERGRVHRVSQNPALEASLTELHVLIARLYAWWLLFLFPNKLDLPNVTTVRM